jgi:hypothetical protein
VNDGGLAPDMTLATLPPTWEGRDVTFAEWSVADDREVRKAFEVDRDVGAFMLLSKALCYADTNERVFSSAAEIEMLPKRLVPKLQRLASLAIDAVGKYDDDGSGAVPPTSGQSGTLSTG